MDGDAAQAIGARLAALYADVGSGPMRDMPVCNTALDIEAIGFRLFGERAVGVVVTPWFMNVVAVNCGKNASDSPANCGRPASIWLPAGDVEFVGGWLDSFGLFHSCSLFSPMFDFPDMTAARQVAEEAIAALFNPLLFNEESATKANEVDRRALLRGRLGVGGESRP